MTLRTTKPTTKPATAKPAAKAPPLPALPEIVTAGSMTAWIAATFPDVVVDTIATWELQAKREGRPVVVRFKLPHDGVVGEGSATWPGVLQRLAGGTATETSKWDDAVEWPVAWPVWVAGWLTALQAPAATAVRPGAP